MLAVCLVMGVQEGCGNKKRQQREWMAVLSVHPKGHFPKADYYAFSSMTRYKYE